MKSKAHQTPRRRTAHNVPQAAVGIAGGSHAWPKAETVWCVRGMSSNCAVIYRTAVDLVKYGFEVFLGRPQLRASAVEHMRAYPDGVLCLTGMSESEEEEAVAYEARTGEKVLFGWRKLSWVLG